MQTATGSRANGGIARLHTHQGIVKVTVGEIWTRPVTRQGLPPEVDGIAALVKVITPVDWLYAPVRVPAQLPVIAVTVTPFSVIEVSEPDVTV